MAGGKALNVKMNFQIDTTQAQQQLKGLYSQLNQITSASAFGRNSQLGITSQIMEATKAAAQLKTALAEATNPLTGNLNLTAFSDQLRMSGMSLNDYRNQLQNLGTTGNAAFNQLTRSIATAEAPMLRVGKAAQTMWTVLGNTIRWQATSSMLHGIMSTAQQAMSYVKSLDTSLNHIRIVTGQSEEQMARFAKTANQAAKELNTSTNEYAKASLIYYQQGLSNKQVEERTRATIKLANVAGQSAKTVSDQMTAVWNNFYDGSKSLEYYADVITALGASTASSSEEIAKGLQKFSSIAQTTGLSYEYATSALSTVVAATRQSADSVGTSFKTLFSRLQGLSLGEVLDDGTTLNKYSQALNTVGVNIKKANGDLKDMDTILDELGNKWSSLGQDTKIALAQTVGGVRNYTGLMSLMEHWDEFQVNLKTAQNAQGTLQTQADIYAESWQAASAHVKAASETIYKNLLDDKVFKGLTNSFGSVLDIVGSITNSLGGFGGTMMGLVSIASKVFAPQMSNMFTNIGMSIHGRSAAIKMQEDAIAALKEPVYISQYNNVNTLQTQINKDLQNNIIAQRKAIETGKMPTYLQPAYNWMMNTVGQQGQEAIAAAENFEMVNAQRRVTQQAEITRLNAAGRQNQGANYAVSMLAKDAAARANGATPILTDSQRYVYSILGGQYTTAKGTTYRAGEFFRDAETSAASLMNQQYSKQMLAQAFGANMDSGSNGMAIKNALGFSKTLLTGNGAIFSDKGIIQNEADVIKSLTQTLGDDKLATGLIKFYHGVQGVGNIAALQGPELTKYATLFSDFNNILDGSITDTQEAYENIMSRIEAGANVQFGGDKEAVKTYMTGVRERANAGGFAEFQKLWTAGKYQEAAKALGLDFDKMLNGTAKISGGQATTSLVQGFASVGTTLMSAHNAWKVFSDDNATAEQKASALVTTLGTMPMAIHSITNVAKNWKTTIDGTNMSMGKLTLTTAGIAVALGATVAVIKELNRYTDEAALKRYNNAIAAAQQRASDAKESYEQSITLQETYNKQQEKIAQLDYGSVNRINAIIDSNNAARTYIQEYGLQYGTDYTYDHEGKIKIGADVFNRIQDRSLKQSQQASQDQEYLRLGKDLLEARQEIAKGSGSAIDAIRASDTLSAFEKFNKESQLIRQADSWALAARGSDINTENQRLIETTGYNIAGDFVGDYLGSQQAKAAVQGLAELTGSILRESYTEGVDLAVASISNNESYIQAINGLADEINKGTVGSWAQSLGLGAKGEGLNLKQIYTNLAKQGYILDSELPSTEDEQRAAIIPALFRKYMLEGKAENFEGLENLAKEYAKDEKLNPLLNFKSLTEQALNEELEAFKIEGSTDEIAYYTDNYGDIVASLNQAVTNIKSGLLTGLNTYITPEALGQNQTIRSVFEDLVTTFSLKQLEQINTYITQAGSVFGNRTAKTVLDKISEGKNAEVLTQLSKVNWDNTFSALKGIEQLAKNVGSIDNNLYSDILNEAIEDMGGEGGLFQKLYNSSGFQDIIGDLTTQFSTLGEITTSYVAKLSGKSEELSTVLGLSNSRFANFNLNIGGITSLLNAISKGSLTSKQVTSSLASSLSTAKALEAQRQKSFEVVDNQDLGRSGTDLLDYFSNYQKAYLTAKSQNMTYDEPLRQLFDHLFPENIQAQYYQAIANGDNKSFKDIISTLPQPVQDFLNTTNKKGTKGQIGWTDIIDLYQGFFEDQNLTEGMISQILPYLPEGTELTSKNTIADLLKSYADIEFKDNNIHRLGKLDLGSEETTTRMQRIFDLIYSSADADAMSSMFMGYMSNNSVGYQYNHKDAEEAIDKFRIGEGTPYQTFSDGTTGGTMRVQSKEEARVLYNEVKPYLDQNQIPDETTFLNYLLENGNFAWAPELDKDFWTQDSKNLTIDEIGKAWSTSNNIQGLENKDAFTNFLATFGVIGENGNLDFNRFNEAIAFLGGSEGSATTLLKNNWDYFSENGLTSSFLDIAGNRRFLTPYEGESYENFQKRYNKIHTEATSTSYWDPVTQTYVDDPYGYKREYATKVTDFEGNMSQGLYNYWLNKQQGNGLPIIDQATREAGLQHLADYYNISPDQIQVDPETGKYYYNGDGHRVYMVDKQGYAERYVGDQKAINDYYDSRREDIETAAKTYSTAIENRVNQGKGITGGQQELMDLWNTYGALNQQQKESPLGRALLRAMDDLIDNTAVTAENTGELAEAKEGEEQQGVNGRQKSKEEQEELENEEYVPPSEEEQVSGGMDLTGGTGPQPQKSLADRINDAFKKGDENAPEGTKVTSVTIDGVQYTRDDTVSQDASGQNNNLLTFASGSKGHIAVTGELGPELRIKEDGSADLLGKKGREYTWVEPTDRIYTATQTAGILGSNNIPALEGLAKGIQNYLPGYAGRYHTAAADVQAASSIMSSISKTGSTDNPNGKNSEGGYYGGGGGEEEKKDPRYDPNTLKIRDVLERYYTILQKIDDITRAVERFSKVADQAWGKDRIKAIEKQTELYKQQYDAQKKYVSEIGEYLNTDEQALTQMIDEFVQSYNEGKDDKDKLTWTGAQFDSNGVLTNYRDFVEKLVAQYNENADENAQDKEAQYKFQEQLKDIQFYTETLNSYEAETDKLIDLANQIIDSSLKEITYRVEYELELNNDLERVLDFKSDLVKDNVFKTAEYLALLDEEMDLTADNLSTIQQGVYDYLGTLVGDNMRNGKTYTTNDLGITKRVNGTDEAIDYNNINFKQVTKNLDTWLADLRKKDAESAEEVDKIIKRGEGGLIENYREIFDKINAMNQKLSQDSIALLKSDVQEFFNQLSSIKDNPMWSGLKPEQKDQLTDYMEQTITELNKLRDQFKNTIESLGDSLKDMNKKIGSEIEEFGYYGDIYQNFLGIINLTNRHMTDISNDFFKNLNSKVFDNNINKIKATNTNLKLQTQNLEEVNAQYEAMIARRNAANAAGDIQMADFYQEQADLLKDQLDIANKAYEDSMKDFQQAWKDALEGAKSAYEDAVKEASRTFEDSFSPFFHTLELLEAQYAREKALGDLYVDDYQRIHDLSKLNRDIENSILDTDNLKSKERLRDLQKEINDLQDSGVELSEYDLDILDKKYKLELARQALEDARDAKSLVRLTRDNNGNWGYVYTSNEDDVAEAEQQYEDAIREMEEANENYIDSLQDQMLQVQKEAQQAIQALKPDDFGTWDEYMAAIQSITDNANQTLAFLANQMNNATGNNDYLAPFIEDRYGINDHNLTTDYADTPLAKLLGVNSLDQMTEDALNRLMDLGDEAGKAWITFQENQEQIFNAADHDIAHIGDQFTHEMETVAQQSKEQVETVEELADRIQEAFADTAGQVTAITDEWADSVKSLTDEYTLLLEVITELKRLDGEYVEPTKMINADNAIDSWKEISDFKKNLAANGVMSLLTTNDEGVEFADTYIAGSAAANTFIKGAMAKAARAETGVFDIDGSSDPMSTYDQIMQYLEKRGIAIFKWKGKEHTVFSKDDETLKQLLEAIQAQKKAQTVSSGYWGGSSSGGAAPWGYVWMKDGSLGKLENAANPSGNITAVVTNPAAGLSASKQSTGYINIGNIPQSYYNKSVGGLSGMYTGEWSEGSTTRGGRLAFLHQKELVLNAHDTENFLDAMEIVRQLDNLTNWMANGLGDLFVPSVSGENGELEQNVHIEASFPNVTNHNEIEMAFDNLVNRASQYANRK